MVRMPGSTIISCPEGAVNGGRLIPVVPGGARSNFLPG